MQLRRRIQTHNTEPSKTQQEFRDECNIRTILEKAKRYGMPQPTSMPNFDDFTGVDFFEVQRQMLNLNNSFNSLHPSVRRRFDNNPAALIAFLSDENNRPEAEKLGLVAPKIQDTPVVGTVPPLDVTVPTDTISQNGVKK